jgi:uncharacterized tellurite resistance protein B-like protein
MDSKLPPEELSLDTLASGEATPQHLQVAIVITLLEAAHSGGGLSGEELMRVSSRIFSHFGMSDIEIGHLIEIADIIRKDSVKKDKFIADIASNFTLMQKQEILSIVWRILIIDGEVDSNEAHVAVDIRKALGLSMEAAVAARLRAEENEISLLVKSIARSVSEEESDQDSEA